MKKLKVLVNKKNYEIQFDYKSETNELYTNVIDSKGNRLDKRKTRIIIKELLKGFRVQDSCMALQVLTKKDSPIVLYTDDEGEINPVLFYERNDFDSMDEVELNIPKLKFEKFLNISTQVASYFLLLAIIINFCQDKLNEKHFEETIKASSQTVKNNYDEDFLKSMLEHNHNLTEEDKELLLSSEFIRDLSNTNMTLDQKTIMCYQLNNLKITDYNTLQKGAFIAKELLGTDTLYGYVLDGEHRQDTIYMLEHESEYSKLVLVHEFIHIAQLDNDYSYLKEASAEIIAHEYWDRPIISYQNAVKRIYALMSIIGPETIWNANFTSTDLLKEELGKYLTPEEVTQFMECLKVKPYNQKFDEETGIGETDKKIDNLIKKLYERKYNKQMDNDYTINSIYNMTSEGNIHYFVTDEEISTPIYFFNKNKIYGPTKPVQLKKIVK